MFTRSRKAKDWMGQSTKMARVRSSERLVMVYGNTPAKDSDMRLDTGSVRPARAKTSNS